jgi:ABC-type Mn2+/Zn2+ transport system ATPase subunit
MAAASRDGDKHTALVTARGATVWRAGRVVVDGLDLVVHAGRVHALVGDNGAGKSTVLQGILGTLPSTIARQTDDVGYAPQRLLPAPHLPLSVADLVALRSPRDGWRRLWRPRPARVVEVLRAAGLDDVAPSRALHALSAGQLARLLVAWALVPRPALCLLDEPTASVDVEARGVVHRLIATARAAGTAVVLVSHDADEVNALADDVTRLSARTAP